VVRSDLDLITEFGHLSGGMLSYPVNVSDGELTISFLHGPVQQPLVNAIEVMSQTTNFTSLKTSIVFGKENDLKIYPNPIRSGTMINMVLNSANNEILKIDIFDIKGAKIHSSKKEILSGSNFISIPSLNLTSGMYILRAHLTSRVVYNRKLIIE
uniref:T9SS type A sorting domain-containing protein n=1 Tax=uncultured Croceitalea sp. TaxID=1798908 RepID=UPI003305CCB4